MTSKIKCDIVLNRQEQRLIELLRELGYGEVVIHVKDYRPYRIETIKKSEVL